MSGFLCVRSGRGRGCYPLTDPADEPEQLELGFDVDVEAAERTPEWTGYDADRASAQVTASPAMDNAPDISRDGR